MWRASVMWQGTDTVGSYAIQKATATSIEHAEVDEKSTELLNKTFSKQSSKNVSDVNVEESNAAKAHNVSVKNISTTAHLSAQIMNLSYRDFKETLSHKKPEKVYYNTNDILKRIKDAYDACTCKICECIIGKSVLSRAEPCNCEPCNCKDCASYRKGDIDPRTNYVRETDKELDQTESIVESKYCSCQPCDCIQCAKIDSSKPCNCQPCQCVECKSMMIRNKTLVVAPVGEGTGRRANCLCAPCDCTRCMHRGLNLSPNRVHEMSTGINRHPNCHCEACVDEACEPNGTDSCRCQGRQGVIRKPVERNPNDFDIHRTIVSNKPVNIREGRFKTMFLTINNDKPQQNNLESIEKECKCSICECIVCKCKGNDMSNSKTPQYTNKTIKTLKLPSIDSKICKCLPCDCECCSDKTQGPFAELIEFKGCTCEICDCIQCEGVAKPRNTFSSRIIPVTDTWTKVKCECRPCECNDCRLKTQDGEVCHSDICRCDRCAFKGNPSEEDLYPIKKGELLTSSLLRRDSISETDILSQTSEYTELKHSKGQSNVFKRESRVPERSKQNFTIFHMAPEADINQASFEPAKSLNPVIQSSWSNELKSIVTACLHDPLAASSSYRSLTPSLLSILSTQNYLDLSPSLSNNNKTLCQLSISSPDRKVKNQDQLNKTRRIGSLGTCNNKKQSDCHIYSCCGQRCYKNELNTLINNKVTQTPQNKPNQDDDSLLNHPLVKYLLSDYSDFNRNSIVSNDSHQKSFDYKVEHIDIYKSNVNAWRLQRSDPYSLSTKTVNLELPDKCVQYKNALITLQKAKAFSLELVKLLEQYEKANSEFESIAKKLKQSQESILDSFENKVLVGTYEDISSDTECYRIELPNNNVAQTLDCDIEKARRCFRDNSSLPPITENSKRIKKILKERNHYDRLRLNDKNHLNKAIAVKSANDKQKDVFKSKSSKQIIESDSKNDNIVTENSESSIRGLLCVVDSTDKIDKKTNNAKPPANYYKVYRKLMKRSAYIAKKYNQKIKSLSESKLTNQCLSMDVKTPKTIETDIVNEMIKKEMHVIFEEFKNPPAEDAKAMKASPVVKKESPIGIMEINSFAEESRPNSKSLLPETVPMAEIRRSVMSITNLEDKGAEKITSTENSSAMDETPFYSSNNALENLQFNSSQDGSCSLIQVRESKSGCDNMKVGFLIVRRVSDHTALVKWEKPKGFQDINGYEILVDGRAVQKIFSPSRCMAVVTCLPRVERMLLTIRTITNVLNKSGSYPCSTVVYRPRAK